MTYNESVIQLNHRELVMELGGRDTNTYSNLPFDPYMRKEPVTRYLKSIKHAKQS
jgi:hypothetical protein